MHPAAINPEKALIAWFKPLLNHRLVPYPDGTKLKPRIAIDVEDIKERLERQKADPKQSLASVIRVLVLEALEARETRKAKTQ